MGLTTQNLYKKSYSVSLPSESKQSLGGGWSFRRNLIQGLQDAGITVHDDWNKASIVLLTSSTMVTSELVDKIKSSGKKIILRVDNLPRNSRNRNTGTSRLKRFASMADEIVYQCEWSQKYLSPFLDRHGHIIYNGVDTTIFNANGPWMNDLSTYDVYLYSRYNRDETKNWEVAWYKYQLIHRENKNAALLLTGQFSPEQIEYNFDFYNGERVIYLGVINTPQEMARVYRSSDYLMATYYNDCYSNTYQEAMACGVKLFEPDMSGGTPELIKNGPRSLKQMTDDYISLFERL